VDEESPDNGLFIYYSLSFLQKNTFEMIEFAKTETWFKNLFQTSLKLVLINNSMYAVNFNSNTNFGYTKPLIKNQIQIQYEQHKCLHNQTIADISEINDKTFLFNYATNKRSCLHSKFQDIHSFIDLYLHFQKNFFTQHSEKHFYIFLHYTIQKYFKATPHFTKTEQVRLHKIFEKQYETYYNEEYAQKYFTSLIINFKKKKQLFSIFCETCNKGLQLKDNKIFCRCFRKVYCCVECQKVQTNHVCTTLIDARNHIFFC